MALTYLVCDPKRHGHHGNVRDEGYDEDGKSIVRKRCGAPRLPPRLPPLRPRRAVPSHPNSCTAFGPAQWLSPTLPHQAPPRGPGWLDAYPSVRAMLNAKSEAEPGYTGYVALAEELLKLPELSNFDASVGSKDYKWLYKKVGHFFSGRRRTPEQLRANNIKKRSKKRAACLQPAARLRIVYL